MNENSSRFIIIKLSEQYLKMETSKISKLPFLAKNTPTSAISLVRKAFKYNQTGIDQIVEDSSEPTPKRR